MTLLVLDNGRVTVYGRQLVPVRDLQQLRPRLRRLCEALPALRAEFTRELVGGGGATEGRAAPFLVRTGHRGVEMTLVGAPLAVSLTCAEAIWAAKRKGRMRGLLSQLSGQGKSTE